MTSRALLTTPLLAALLLGGRAGAIEVGVLHGYFYSDDVEDLLAAQLDIDVTTFDYCYASILDDFDVLVLYGTGNCWSDVEFEAFVAAGGGVIGTPWIFNNGASSYSYLPYSVSSTTPIFAQPLDSVVLDPADGMLDGVTFVDGDSVGWEDVDGVTVEPWATVPVTHADGDPLVAYGPIGLGRSVYLHLQYITSDCDLAVDHGWGQQLLLNAVYWAAGTDFCSDLDLDGDGWTGCEGDCDDGDPAVHPGAAEVCEDGIDSNCDGQADETADDDGDGFSNCDGDCDDFEAAAWPGNVEICDRVDNDCNGVLDDGFGDGGLDQDFDGFTGCEGDCDDGEPSTYPGATEMCDGLDNDCDGSPEPFEVDADGDGYLACEDCLDIDPAIHPDAEETCDDGVDSDCLDDLDDTEVDDDGDGWSECAGDCDDIDATTHPQAEELCNGGVDDDCDPATDEEVDRDTDGYSACEGDCDEDDATVSPAADEICDGVDNDCNGLIDDGLDRDLDGHSSCDGDCDDDDPDVHPGATEIPDDGVDQDCDGTDEVSGGDEGAGLGGGSGGCACGVTGRTTGVARGLGAWSLVAWFAGRRRVGSGNQRRNTAEA